MLKKSVKSVILCSMLVGTTSLFAADGKDNAIVLDKDSNAATVILKSDKEYRDYLMKIGDSKSLEALLYKHDCDINMLKAAVAKLIKKVDGISISNEELNKATRNVANSVQNLSEKQQLLKDRIGKGQNNVSNDEAVSKKDKDTISDLDSADVVNEVKDSNDVVEITAKKNCKTIKVKRTYSISETDGSFIKFDEPKEFKVTWGSLDVFEKPLLDYEHDSNVYKKGDKFIADMYTLAGWVHVKDKGWVKGYKLYPKVLQKDVKDTYTYVKKCD